MFLLHPMIHPIPTELIQLLVAQHGGHLSTHFLQSLATFFTAHEDRGDGESSEGEDDPLSAQAIIVWGEREELNRGIAYTERMLSKAAQVEDRQGEALRAILFMQTKESRMNVQSFADCMRMEPHKATELLDVLEKKGLVLRERKLDVSYREKFIVFTEEGERKARTLTFILLHGFKQRYLRLFQQNITTLLEMAEQEYDEE